MKLTEEFKERLESEGYMHLREVEGRGICGLMKFIFTVGLVYGIDQIGYKGRWCYPNEKAADAVYAFGIWDGKSDPMGCWIKHKGHIEYSNPNKKKKQNN